MAKILIAAKGGFGDVLPLLAVLLALRDRGHEMLLAGDRQHAVLARDAGVPFTTQRVGGMFGMFFTDERVDTYAQAMACDSAAFNRFFHAMLRRGVYLAPSAFEAGFMSSAHTDDVIRQTVEAAQAAFASLS